MGDLSTNYSRWEHECHCGCGFNTMDIKQNEILEETREHFVKKYPDRKISVIINSGARCMKYHLSKGYSRTSQHPLGKADDIVVNGIDDQGEVYEYLDKKYPKALGLGRYLNRTHVDTREGGEPTNVNPIPAPARWDNR